MTNPQHDTHPSENGSGSKKRLVAGIAIVAVAAIVAAAVLLGNRDDGSATAADPDLIEQPAAEHHANPDALVATDWLAGHLNDPNIVIIEVSENRPNSGLTNYEGGHIPGAIEYVWTEDFVQSVSRDVATREQFTATARAKGIDDDSTIVIYGDANNWFAAWGAWVFNYYGAADVRLLDGGKKKWVAEGRELAQAAPVRSVGNFDAKAPNNDIRAFQPEVLDIALAESPDAAVGHLVDIRGPQEYNGEIAVAEGFPGEAAVKLGHIPNAVNVPWASIVNDDGSFKPTEEIREIYANHGVDGSKPVVVYCRIGERASHTWYALSQLLGYDVKLYDGSWTEWGNSVAVPIQNNTLQDGQRSGLWSRN